jgi:tight adherence protein B
MIRRLLASFLVMLLAFVSSASADAGGARISLQPGAQFPDRQFVVTLPTGAHPYDVQVSENGVPVIPHLVSLNTTAVPVSLAVLLDTSNSMRGKPLRAALDAAQTLIDQKSFRSEVAVYGFSQRPYVIHQWATDRSAFQASLASVSVTHGTALWDAVTYASQELRGRTGSSKAIVVLTDGADNSSTATAVSATAVARSVGAHVYAVGLPGVRSEATDVQALVDETGGDFIRVSSLTDLKSVYSGLATRLKQQYQLSYQSQLRGVGKPVTVRLDVNGASAEQRYTIPPTKAAVVAAPSAWWTGAGALVGIAFAVGLVILVSAYLALRPVPISARRRLRRYGQKGAPDTTSLPDALPQRPRPDTANGNRWWARFVADVDRGEIDLTPERVLAVGFVGGAVVLGIIGLATGYPLIVLAGAPLGAIAAWAYVGRRAAAWHTTFDAALADSLLVLASSLRAGHSLLQAVAHVAEEADEKSAREWNEVVRRTRLGVSVEDALDEMVVRVGNRDLQWIALVARVQHQVGGNMAEMFDIVADTVRQRQRLREALHTLTAQGRMTRWILTFAPLAIGVMLFLQSPTYIVAFLHDPIGQALLGGAVVLIVIGSLWLKRIVEIEV